MNRQAKEVTKADLMPLEEYSKNRTNFRKKILEIKKNRRISVGPYATFYFESFETMLGQIQEMLYIEKGGEEQLKDELNAYNPLIPKGRELIATLMFEIDDPMLRTDFLGKVGGIEEQIYIQISDIKIKADSEKDVDRTSAEGKASSVQFIHFNFSNEQIKKFKHPDTKISLSIDHSLYNHVIEISKETKNALAKDFI